MYVGKAGARATRAEPDLERDHELLQRICRGDEQAFSALYERWQRPIYRFALQMSGTPAIAEEAVQETFLSLLRAPGMYDSAKGSISVYLFGTARNILWRAIKRERTFISMDEDHELFSDEGEHVAHMDRLEQAEHVRRAILALPKDSREVIVLCDLQELTYEEAAAVVGCAVGTVRSRLHRARGRLITQLKTAAQVLEVKRRIARCPV